MSIKLHNHQISCSSLLRHSLPTKSFLMNNDAAISCNVFQSHFKTSAPQCLLKSFTTMSHFAASSVDVPPQWCLILPSPSQHLPSLCPSLMPPKPPLQHLMTNRGRGSGSRIVRHIVGRGNIFHRAKAWSFILVNLVFWVLEVKTCTCMVGNQAWISTPGECSSCKSNSDVVSYISQREPSPLAYNSMQVNLFRFEYFKSNQETWLYRQAVFYYFLFSANSKVCWPWNSIAVWIQPIQPNPQQKLLPQYSVQVDLLILKIDLYLRRLSARKVFNW